MRPLHAAGAGAGALVLAIAASPGALAAPTDYSVRSFRGTAESGLPVKPPLDELVAVARVRIVVPDRWRPQSSGAGRLRFLSGKPSCSYRITVSVRSSPGAPAAPEEHMNAALPPSPTARVLDAGRRHGSAFSVRRDRSVNGIVRVRAIHSSVLTRRDDIAPAGQVVWSDLSVDARSRPGDECHAGTYRGLGQQIADVLATARATLSFVPTPTP